MRITAFVLMCFFVFIAHGQVQLSLWVTDSLQIPVPDALVIVGEKSQLTDAHGKAQFELSASKIQLHVQHLSYVAYAQAVELSSDTSLHIRLMESASLLEEVTITAREIPRAAATTHIGKRAIEHLQASSFTEILSLIPGKNHSNTQFGAANSPLVRERKASDADYQTSSLGISFWVDGSPVSTAANMQRTTGVPLSIHSAYHIDQRRNSTRSGMDMRRLSSDDVQSVEVIRGVSSLRYANYTSAVVKISRTEGSTPLRFRLKSDGFSKLFFVGKGFSNAQQNAYLNLSFDVLAAQPDPRDTFERFTRYTFSLRTGKTFQSIPLQWRSTIDYTGSLDEVKTDTDVLKHKDDAYSSSYKSIQVAQQFKYSFPYQGLSEVECNAHFTHSSDKIIQQKHIQIRGARAMPVSLTAGEYYGTYLSPYYLSHLLVEGKPTDALLQVRALGNIPWGKSSLSWEMGADYNWVKNYGRGEVFDLFFPPSDEPMNRPHDFSKIPPLQRLSPYGEISLRGAVGGIKYTLFSGLRSYSFVGMDKRYALAQRPYYDQRNSLMLTLPSFAWGEKQTLSLSMWAGYGGQQLMPTLGMIYPPLHYHDFTQLNYYHPQKEFRAVHFKTAVVPKSNFAIVPAYNLKKELGISGSCAQHDFSLSYFWEKMSNAFREENTFGAFHYKEYLTTGLLHQSVSAAPQVEALPFEPKSALLLWPRESNGSAVYKEGLEWQYSSKRMRLLHTRFTLSGAYVMQTNRNSQQVYRYASQMTVAGGKHYLLGVYPDEEKGNSSQWYLQSTLHTDTHWEKLGLTASLRCDVDFFHQQQLLPFSAFPSHYIDESGVLHAFTEEDKNHPVRQFLVRHIVAKAFEVERTPLSLYLHLRVSKNIFKKFQVAMYVNNIYSYGKDYYKNNYHIKRRYIAEPYFGMEVSGKL